MITLLHIHNTSYDFHNIFSTFIEVFKEALTISFFVIIMMLIIEYITVQSKGRWNKSLQRSPMLQILLGALLGIIPGCLGAFTAVSLYVHKIFSFAALVTVMIATSGDEAFIMLSMMPKEALFLNVIILTIAILTGWIIHISIGDKTFMKLPVNHLTYHTEHSHCNCFVPKELVPQLKSISFTRALLISAGVVFLVLLLNGELVSDTWDWVRVTFLIVTLIGLFIVSTTPDHFLTDHLWNHVIKKHLLKIFLWIFGTFIVIDIVLNQMDLNEWLQANQYVILIIALLIGIIPQSGPNIIFISLFIHGSIPFSILLANSIVQDGHGALPLLAESRKSFLAMKAVNVAVGALVGILGMLFGF